jgi:hypothetical protein
MAQIIDTEQLVNLTKKTLNDLIEVLREKGFPVPDSLSLCEIVELLNSGVVSYCGFVRCGSGNEFMYFPDEFGITIDVTKLWERRERICVQDKLSNVLAPIHRYKLEHGIAVQEFIDHYSFSRSFAQTGTRWNYDDFYAVSIYRPPVKKGNKEITILSGITIQETKAWELKSQIICFAIDTDDITDCPITVETYKYVELVSTVDENGNPVTASQEVIRTRDRYEIAQGYSLYYEPRSEEYIEIELTPTWDANGNPVFDEKGNQLIVKQEIVKTISWLEPVCNTPEDKINVVAVNGVTYGIKFDALTASGS